ncbi:MAG TPA: sucrase ferredoxin [Gaiellaceae bacterium]|nr:sucrase ferredoxin [Gaiellaceae bacterium]
MAVGVQDMPEVARRALCASVSSASAEPLAATASRIDHWILVEYRGLWDRDVLGGSLLSSEVKTHLRGQLRALGDARLLFLKKPERRSYGRRQLFFGTSAPGRERFFQLEFDRHDDLVGLDLAAALSGAETPGVPLEHPLFVVCTHGKRDRCCAKYGRPLYDALRRETESEWVWQSTHVGGDRFAGNVVVFPAGLYFGRVGREDVRPLLHEHAAGNVLLERYRGRSAYSFAVQAAEHAVRVEAGFVGVDDLALLAAEEREGGWLTRFRDATGAVHEVEVDEVRGEEAVYLTCGAVTPQHARRYAATSHRVTRP